MGGARGTCGPAQEIVSSSVPSRNLATISPMPSAWLLARGPYCPEKAALAKPPPTTVGTPPSVVNPVDLRAIAKNQCIRDCCSDHTVHGKQLVNLGCPVVRDCAR